MKQVGMRELTAMQQIRLVGKGWELRSPETYGPPNETVRTIVRLIREIERLSRLVPSTAAANDARRIAKEERAALARSMRARGMKHRRISKELGVTERHVYRLLEGVVTDEESS